MLIFISASRADKSLRENHEATLRLKAEIEPHADCIELIHGTYMGRNETSLLVRISVLSSDSKDALHTYSRLRRWMLRYVQSCCLVIHRWDLIGSSGHTVYQLDEATLRPIGMACLQDELPAIGEDYSLTSAGVFCVVQKRGA